ncbi:Glycosyl hydrolases family 16 [Sinosporangium album]|uniref:Glycosyl hydrolases family 16 n=1 Tax=Sinosporangium album TaxID=504805 RepID=A0A1G7R9B2_9ACTN|nr:glycoside hydrolase family 16 protein [Sinosporangium album]SDG07396.1 Glycosyl hydrolases family 16 [Sinosporangium album]
MRNAPAVRALAALTALILLLAGCSEPGPGRQEPGGFREVFRDDFGGGADTPVSADRWLHDIGTCYPGCPAPQWGTGEIETMTDSVENVSLDGKGHLAITPLLRNGTWTSGRIETRRADFRYPPGGTMRVEARIALPYVTPGDGAGYWPAFWMLGERLRDGYTGWPGVGEIDVMEAVNGLPQIFGAMHCGVSPGGPCAEPKGLNSPPQPCATCHGTFHTYAVEVSADQVRWYLDGTHFFTVTSAQVDPETWRNAVDHGFFLILNVAIGGGYPAAYGGGPNPATVPGRPMLVDYVAVSEQRP